MGRHPQSVLYETPEERQARLKPKRRPDCHPDRKHYARGMCRQCYMALFNLQHSEALAGTAERRAECHPDRAHYADGLCASCYRKLWRLRRAHPELVEPKPPRTVPMARCHPDRPLYKRRMCRECYEQYGFAEMDERMAAWKKLHGVE